MKKTKYDLVSNSIKKTLITQNNLPWRIAFALFCTSCLLVSGFSVGLNIIKTEDEMNNAFEIDIMKTHRDTSRYHPDITQNKDETYVGSTGYEPYYYSIANIVNPANGNMHITETDLMLPCRGWGLGIDITRDYNTHNSIYSTMFGYGWTFQYNLYLIEHPDNSVVFVEGDGSFFTFNSTGGGDYSQSPGKTMRLHKNLDSSFTLKCCKGGTYTFNSTGTLLSISDKNDNHLYFTYFAEKLINITDDSGLWVAFQYNPEGYVSSLSDPLGRQVYYEYDGKGDLRNVTDPMGNKTMYFYCNESMCTVGHHLIGRVDVSGRVATFEHTLDLATELTKTYAIGNSVYNYTTGSYPAPYIVYDITYASEDVVQFSKRGLISEVHLNDAGNPIMISESDCGCGAIYKEWNSNMNLIKLTNERGYSWVYEYNQYGNILNETNPLNQTTTYTWENINTADRFICLIKTVTDFRGAVTTYTYDGKGNIYNVTDPTGNVTTYSYDTHGSILSIKDARGYYTNYTYDIHGAPASEINAEGDVTNYTYDLSRRLINLTDTNGYTTLYEFDHLNRLTKIIDPEHHIKIYDYNAIGDVVNITDENGNTNSLDNNFMNQVDVLWDPTGNKTEYTYDKFGNLIVFTDATGNSTHYYYNEINRLSETKDAAGNSERYTYDEVGNVQSFTDKTGNTTTFQYDALNRLTYTVRPDSEARSFIYDDLANTMTEIDEEGRSTTTYNDILGRFSQTVNHLGKVVKHYEYDAVGNIITQTDALGNSTCYTFNGNNIATELIDRSGNKTIYCYDSEGNLVNETDPLGYKINYSYDALNRLIRETDHFGNTTKYSYDAVGNLINMIDARGYNTSYQYDTLNRLVKQTDQLGNNQTYRYDALGNIIETIDERGNATHYYYDSLGRLIRETDALGYSILYDYDANGNLIKVTDKRGYETHYTYDSLNRLITIENPDGYTINSTYDQVGNVLSVTNERGYTTTYTYDDLNRLTHVTDATGNSSSYEYDDNNNLVTFIDPNGYYWNYTYDTLNRRTAIISPLGYTTQYTFDQVGNLVNITDANGTKTDYLYDALGRLRCITDALGYKTNYTYDAMDNVKQIEDANHYFTNFTYDPLNQLTQVESFGRTTDYQYDASGNQISRIDPMHHLTNYSYDELNRLKSRTYYPPTQIGSIYDYDPNGNLRYINKTTGSAEYYYEYDSMDRLTQATLHDVAGNLITTEYTYDPVGNRASLTYPYSGIAAIATYDYDKVDRLVNLTFNRGPIQETTNFVYDNAGRRTQTIHPNGVTTTYAYNKMNWISNLWTNNSAGNPLNYYAYTYDPVGNKLSESSAEGTKTYGYDKLYRLTHALTTYPDFTTQTIDYSYDPVGNRLDQKIDGLITTYTYGKNQLTSDSNGNLYYYDFNGNLQQIQGINNINFVYDFENRLTQISQPGKTINYQYTSIGNRLLRIEGSQRTFYAYDYEDMIQEYDDTGVPDATYLHGPGVDEPLSMYNLNTGYTYYYHQDGLGSVTELTDFTQIIVNTYRYDPFGKRKTSTSETVANPFEYTGREYDESANLYYYRARFYDPSIGRFISKDPLEGSFGTDLYIYTRNNPVNYVDPLGLEVVNMPSGRTIVNTPTFEYKNDGYAPVWFAFPNNGNYNVQASMAAGFTGGIGQPNWGPGPKGKQPEYDGKCTCHKECCCWITKPGEFKFTYKVKYVKSGRQNAPAQQGTHTLSLGAAAAINRHEDEHVKLAKIAHNAFINPLMQRVKNYTGRKNSLKNKWKVGSTTLILGMYAIR